MDIRYSYVKNSPLIYTDLTGHYIPEIGPGNHIEPDDLDKDIINRIETGRWFHDDDNTKPNTPKSIVETMVMYVHSLNNIGILDDRVTSIMDKYYQADPTKNTELNGAKSYLRGIGRTFRHAFRSMGLYGEEEYSKAQLEQENLEMIAKKLRNDKILANALLGGARSYLHKNERYVNGISNFRLSFCTNIL